MRARPGRRRSARSRQPLRPRRTDLSRAWPGRSCGRAAQAPSNARPQVSSPLPPFSPSSPSGISPALGQRTIASIASATAITIRAIPIARRRTSSERRPVSFAPNQPPTRAAGAPTASSSQSTSVRAACAARPTVPTANPTTRFVPTALAAVMPTPRRSTGIRIVPRITPIAPPSAPTPRPPATGGRDPELRPRLRVERPEQQIGPVEGEDRGGDAEQRRLRQVAAEVAAEEPHRRSTAGASTRRPARRPAPHERAGASPTLPTRR